MSIIYMFFYLKRMAPETATMVKALPEYRHHGSQFGRVSSPRAASSDKLNARRNSIVARRFAHISFISGIVL
jgi:hypothetical protein